MERTNKSSEEPEDNEGEVYRGKNNTPAHSVAFTASRSTSRRYKTQRDRNLVELYELKVEWYQKEAITFASITYIER